jgi:hypothetical protein
MDVNCDGIGNLLLRLTSNVWLNDNFEEQTLYIEQTQGNEVNSLSSCSLILSVKVSNVHINS